MKKNKWIIPVVIIIVAAAAIGLLAKNAIGGKKLHFTTVKAEKGSISQTVVTTGTLNPVISVNVGAQVSGKIEKIYVDYNSQVKKGQLLAKIDPSLFEAQVEESRASYESSLASVQNMTAQYNSSLMSVKKAQANTKTAMAKEEMAKASLQSAKDSLNSSKANLEKSKATLENRRLEFERAEKLFKENFISASEKDSAEMNYKVAKADIDVATAAVKQAESSLTSAKLSLESATYDTEANRIAENTAREQAESSLSQLKSAKANSKQSKSRLEQNEVNLSYTKIYSPIDGVVTSRRVDEGQTVASSFNTPELFIIAKDLRNMEVIANVDEADIGKVKNDMSATFTVDAFPTETFSGAVKQVRSVATTESGVVTYQVVISAYNPDLKLMPGMTANITITTQTTNECIKIPNAALRFDPDKIEDFPRPDKKQMEEMRKKREAQMKANPERRERRKREFAKGGTQTVWVLQPNGMPRPVRVKIGITGGNYTEMVEGKLKEGDEIITNASKTLKSKKQERKEQQQNRRGPGGPGGGPMRV